MTTDHQSTPNDSAAHAAITETIRTVFAGADDHRWADVEAAMSPTIVVDYAALGGATGEVAAKDLVAGWAAFLPGFDRTVHHLHELSIFTAGDRATATLEAIAVHALTEGDDTAIWTVLAGYDAELERVDGRWRLARLALNLRQQTGDLSLPERAGSRGADRPTQEAPVDAVEAFFSALEANDLAALANALAPDAVQEMPLAPAGFPGEVAGREALMHLYGNVIGLPQRYARRLLPTGSSRTVLASFTGEVETDAGVYANHYVSLFVLNEAGRIERIVEHFNPRILLSSWPGLKPAHHSVHAAGASTDAVTREAVSFDANGVTLRGDLYRPSDADRSTARPAVIVAGSWTSVKGQMAGTYASRLAAEGMVALAFDFTGYGESDGVPRQLEDPQRKIADIRAAFAFIRTQPGVDAGAISGLGVCAGAGYMAHAVAAEPGFSQLALVAPWLHDEAMARGIYDLRPGGSDGLIAAGRAAAEAYDATGEAHYVLAASELDPLTAMYVPGNVFDYYLNPTKGAGPAYDNRFAVASWEPWITFDAIGAAGGNDRPVTIVHSESGAVPDGAKRFHAALRGDARIAWLSEYGQEDFYHRPEAIRAALAVVVPRLRQ